MSAIKIDAITDISHFGLDVARREIYLHSHISSEEDDSGLDFRIVPQFIKNIRLLNAISQEPVLIHMNLVGGDWSAGMAIFDAIELCTAHVTIVVYGQAESMSTIILQAADARIMTPSAWFMVHYGTTAESGQYLNVHNAMKLDKKICEDMLDIYSDVCIKGQYFRDKYTDITHEKVKNYLKRKFKDGDWYLTAEEAVHYGFADGVLKTRKFPNLECLKS